MAEPEERRRGRRTELLVALLRCLLYGGLCALFFGLMGIRNWPLRHFSRTLATTLLTWWIMTFAMTAIYGGYDVGRRKSRPICSGLALSTLLTDLATYLQLQVMNTNANANDHLILFGVDLLWLILCIALQLVLITGLVRLGNHLFFRLNPPRRCLLVLSRMEEQEELTRKISRYRLQWQVKRAVLWTDPDLRREMEAAEVVFLGDVPGEAAMPLMQLCYDLHRDVMCKAQLTSIMLSAARPLVVDDAPFLEVRFSRMTWTQRAVKRGGDLVLSALLLLLLSPLLALIALLIRREDGGPVLFRQERLTVHGRRFTILKFRTMTPQAQEGRSAAARDSRVTRVGAFLRRYRLDELPQLVNILRGDMSLVGPRPEMLSNVDRYKRLLPAFVSRERVRAGLTGYAQIEGRYNTSPEDKLMLDLLYIENFSLWLDVRLIFRTLTVLFKPDSTAGFDWPPEEI